MPLTSHDTSLLLKGFEACHSLTTREINKAIRLTDRGSYLWGVETYGLRVTKARRVKGTIQFHSLNSGKWITPGPTVRFTCHNGPHLHFAAEPQSASILGMRT